MTEDKLLALEKENQHVEVLEHYKSPAGDTATVFLDREFTRIENWLNLKLKDSFYKPLILTQLRFVYSLLRAVVVQALT